MNIRARDLQTDHLGQTVHVPYKDPFTLAHFRMILWEPNPYTDRGDVHLWDPARKFYKVHPDEVVEVTS